MYTKLTDFAPVYLTDPKLNWEPFRKTGKDCAVVWNFKSWLNREIYQREADKKVSAAKVVKFDSKKRMLWTRMVRPRLRTSHYE